MMEIKSDLLYLRGLILKTESSVNQIVDVKTIYSYHILFRKCRKTSAKGFITAVFLCVLANM